MAKKRRINTKAIRPKKDIKKQTGGTKKKGINPKIFIFIGSALILTALILWVTSPNPSDHTGDWYVDEHGIMSYPTERGVPIFDSEIYEITSDYLLESLNYASRNANISALLRIPNSTSPVPGILILPGATVTKEGEQGLASELADMGYASMVIDQRNLGGVDFQLDGQLFEAGKEPIEHMMVFDALKAVDVVRENPKIDPDKIAIIGISNGGRFAIIAAAIDPSIKGVVGVSTSGYNTETLINEKSGQMTQSQIRFFHSIDPDSYLNRLPPRKLVMIHMTNDSIIPIDMAQATFEKAENPKSFYPVEGTNHGYNAAMRAILETELEQIFS